MCITKAQIKEFEKVVDKMNSFDSDTDKMNYLSKSVEDVDLFLSVLKNINYRNSSLSSKKKLRNNSVSSNKKREARTIKVKSNYKQEEVIELLKNNKLEDVIKKYSHSDLTNMYISIYGTKPISSYNKTRIAQTMSNYVYTMKRANALLK